MNQLPFLRSSYNYDRDAVSIASGIDCQERTVIDPDTGEIYLETAPTMTQQQFKDETDINTIVRRFGLTGEMPKTIHTPLSGDFSAAQSFEESMQLIRQAEESFMELPAETRYRFHNNPAELIRFLEDDRNRPEAERLGLVNKPPEVPRAEEVKS